MQKIIRILFIKISILCLGIVPDLFAYKHDDVLARADQLFQQKKYSDAYDLYFELWNKNKLFTPQTLLKMAFIKDAWGDHAEALYFFNLFYEYFPDKKIFNKMKEIADKQKYAGYEYSDLEYFSTIYKKYHFQIHIAIIGITIFYFLALATNMFFIKGISTSSPYFFILMLAFSAYFINQAEHILLKQRAVVVRDRALLMTGPSAGAQVAGIIPRGTRIRMEEQTDIWIKIKYNDQPYYIRQCNIEP